MVFLLVLCYRVSECFCVAITDVITDGKQKNPIYFCLYHGMCMQVYDFFSGVAIIHSYLYFLVRSMGTYVFLV